MNAHVSNKTPSGTYRGPGRVEANFFRERLIDMAAADLGVDPADMRRRNFVDSAGDAVQHRPARDLRAAGANSIPAISPRFLSEALEEIGWPDKQDIQGREIDGWYHGIGFASFVESSAGGLKEHARIRLRLDGALDVYVGSTSSGQGHETVFAQVCADALATAARPAFGSSAPRPTNWRKGSARGTAARP